MGVEGEETSAVFEKDDALGGGLAQEGLVLGAVVCFFGGLGPGGVFVLAGFIDLQRLVLIK